MKIKNKIKENKRKLKVINNVKESSKEKLKIKQIHARNKAECAPTKLGLNLAET